MSPSTIISSVRYAIVLVVLMSCSNQVEHQPEVAYGNLFRVLPAEESNLVFQNNLTENSRINVLEYLYYYNGSGVAIGDINNDGLPDIYLAATTERNKLFLNKGNLEFEDITESANAGGYYGITTGVNFIDINQDGFLDIYICKSGITGQRYRTNELLINDGNMHFVDQSSLYGLDDISYSNQSYFFDYDLDGDLDMYLVNHPIDWNNKNKIMTGEQELGGLDYDASDKLYRNNGQNQFDDVTKDAGLLNRSWGLSASVGDFNGDNLPDIYVANDFIKPDYLYINNGDGTFTDRLQEHFRHISFYSMGTDYADINNDGLNDLYVLDMAMKGHARSKMNMGSMSTENFQTIIRRGYHYPYAVNTLHLNLGNELPFAEIAQLSGVDKTDWSWAPLIIDLDNDGFKDIFVTNGIYRDIIDNDFQIKKVSYDDSTSETRYFEDLLSQIPQTKIKNFLFKNNGDLTFSDMTKMWGITEATNSNGASYADLDLDGDLDLVTNNLNEPSVIYENLANIISDNNYLNVSLSGPEMNGNAIGATVEIEYEHQIQRQDIQASRGYLSSSAYAAHFGLGQVNSIDRLTVTWPDGNQTIVDKPDINQRLKISYSNSQLPIRQANTYNQTFVFNRTSQVGFNHRHQEQPYDDFRKELLLPHKLSENGPLISVADVDNNGYDDFYIGGSAGFAGALYMQDEEGRFSSFSQQSWNKDKQFEDQGSIFFDADNDGDQDLYVVSGSNEFGDPKLFQDRLYVNDGTGRFNRSFSAVPEISSSGLKVDAGDFDNDGDLDLVVGGRVTPGAYPVAPRSYLLENDGGNFRDITAEVAAEFMNIGMVTDLKFTDYDLDSDLDLLVVGEWMAITVFNNQAGQLHLMENEIGLNGTKGWWLDISVGDLDHDGDPDYVVGNVGGNNKYQPNSMDPLNIYYSDFDHNGSGDIVLSKKENQRNYPIRGRECTSQQMPFISEKFPTYTSFAFASIEDIYSQPSLDSALRLDATEFSSCVLINDGNGNFAVNYLPTWAQLAPITGSAIVNFNDDENPDLIVAGNFYGTETETIRYDGGSGLFLEGDGLGHFSPIPPGRSGFMATKNVKDIAIIKLADGSNAVLVANNDDNLELWSIATND